MAIYLEQLKKEAEVYSTFWICEAMDILLSELKKRYKKE